MYCKLLASLDEITCFINPWQSISTTHKPSSILNLAEDLTRHSPFKCRKSSRFKLRSSSLVRRPAPPPRLLPVDGRRRPPPQGQSNSLVCSRHLQLYTNIFHENFAPYTSQEISTVIIRK
jgi:hypothetical protein